MSNYADFTGPMIETSDLSDWKKTLSKVFRSLGFYCDYQIGEYTVDYFVSSLSLVLECSTESFTNGSDGLSESERSRCITKHHAFARFHPDISVEKLLNGILRTQLIPTARMSNRNDPFFEFLPRQAFFV